jgi:predicted translin family RNA/ssDNA-binding protein
MYFKKQVVKRREVKIDKPTPQREEFIKVYRKINNNGSYSDALIKKYHEVLKEKTHKEMMDKLSEYQQHLEAFPSKPPLQV